MKIMNSHDNSYHRFEELPKGTLFKKKEEDESGEIYLKIERVILIPDHCPMEATTYDDRVTYTVFKKADPNEFVIEVPMNAIKLSTGETWYIASSTIVEPLYRAILFEDENDVPKKNND